MQRFVLTLLCAVMASQIRAQDADAAPSNLADLRHRIDRHIAQPRFERAHWGMHIVSLDTGVTIFSHNAEKLFLPASNAKLYTCALALDRLGEDYRIHTPLFATARPGRSGLLKGSLIIKGRGDPTMTSLSQNDGRGGQIGLLAAIVQGVGIGEVRGDIVADESWFNGPPYGTDWQWDDLDQYYAAEVSALSVNDNAVALFVQPGPRPGFPTTVAMLPPTTFLTVSNLAVTSPRGGVARLRVKRPLLDTTVYVEGSLPAGSTGEVERVSVPRPAAWFGKLFKAALRSRGVKANGSVRVVDSFNRNDPQFEKGGLVEIGAVTSPPLRELVRRMMKPSQNLHAQLLLLQVGMAETERNVEAQMVGRTTKARTAAQVPSTGPTMAPLPESTEAAGLKALDAFLARVGISPDAVQLQEGSGLSRRDLVTPAATVALLSYMDKHPAATAFRDSLPMAGVDGTLRNRMKNTPAAGNAQAKTGTLNQVHALSGYVFTAAGERVAFSLMLNNYRSVDAARPARDELDDVVVLLSRLPWRSSPAP